MFVDQVIENICLYNLPILAINRIFLHFLCARFSITSMLNIYKFLLSNPLCLFNSNNLVQV